MPVPDPSLQRHGRIILKGDVPSPIDPPSGCRFHPRCRYAEGICSETKPELREIRPRPWAACHLASRVGLA